MGTEADAVDYSFCFRRLTVKDAYMYGFLTCPVNVKKENANRDIVMNKLGKFVVQFVAKLNSALLKQFILF